MHANRLNENTQLQGSATILNLHIDVKDVLSINLSGSTTDSEVGWLYGNNLSYIYMCASGEGGTRGWGMADLVVHPNFDSLQ